jgi:hypothetical protein
MRPAWPSTCRERRSPDLEEEMRGFNVDREIDEILPSAA